MRSVTGGLWPLLGCACMYAAWRRNDDGVREVLSRPFAPVRCQFATPRRRASSGKRGGSGIIAVTASRHDAEKVAGSMAS